MLPVFSFPSPLFSFLKKIKAKCSLRFLNFYALSTHPSPPPSGNLYLNSRISWHNWKRDSYKSSLIMSMWISLSLEIITWDPKNCFFQKVPPKYKGNSTRVSCSLPKVEGWQRTENTEHMTGNFELRNIYSSFHPITYRNVHKLCHVSSYILSGAFLVCAECVEFSKPWIRQSRVVSNIHRTWIWLAENEHPVGLAGQFNKIGSIKVLFHLLED